jgi:cytosine deaminase
MAEMADHERYMDEALKEAREGREEGGIPIGSVMTVEGSIVSQGNNRRVQDGSSVFHAEINCLESAGRRTAEEYRNSVLYSTLSPCSMCSGAVLLYGIPTVVIGENTNFQGPEQYLRDQGVQVINLDREDCISMMADFIREHPQLWNEDIGK